MQFMVRRYASTLMVTAAAALVAACGGTSARESHAPRPPARDAQFATEEARIIACLDLRDHIVDLYATEYETREGLALSPDERTAFRDGWAEQLAKQGTFDRFEQSCFATLTPGKYTCGMASRTTDGLVACMKTSLAESRIRRG